MMLEVGRVLRAHGLSGEVSVALITNRQERLDAGSLLWAPGSLLRVQRARRAGGSGAPRWIVSFEGIHDREAAEGLRGTVLSAEPISDPDALWVHELIGLPVVDGSGTALGTVESVEANPASDLLVLDDGSRIPVRFVVAHEVGTVVVDVPAGLLDL